jgi:type III restriction enzyme
MALHPKFPTSLYAPLISEQRWFPATEDLRGTAYEKLLPPLVAKVRNGVFAWRNEGYPGASTTSITLLPHWFETDPLTENAAEENGRQYDFVFADHTSFDRWLQDRGPKTFASLAASFRQHKARS